VDDQIEIGPDWGKSAVKLIHLLKQPTLTPEGDRSKSLMGALLGGDDNKPCRLVKGLNWRSYALLSDECPLPPWRDVDKGKSNAELKAYFRMTGAVNLVNIRAPTTDDKELARDASQPEHKSQWMNYLAKYNPDIVLCGGKAVLQIAWELYSREMMGRDRPKKNPDLDAWGLPWAQLPTGQTYFFHNGMLFVGFRHPSAHDSQAMSYAWLAAAKKAILERVAQKTVPEEDRCGEQWRSL